MLSRMICDRSRRTSGGRSLRTTLPPNGSGRLGFSFHHAPRSSSLIETGSGIGQLAFVNDETGGRAPGFDRVENLIERHDDVFEFTEKKLKREIGARHFPRDRDQPAAQPVV